LLKIPTDVDCKSAVAVYSITVFTVRTWRVLPVAKFVDCSKQHVGIDVPLCVSDCLIALGCMTARCTGRRSVLRWRWRR